MKRLNILLLGAHINSSNLGCQALTYSLIHVLERISAQNGIPMAYYVFEYQPNEEKTDFFVHKLGLTENKLYSYRFPFVVTLKNRVRNIFSILKFYEVLGNADIAIDVTAGDSFADIYGDYRFLGTTRIKELIEKKEVPLLLAPQTYGPFLKKENEEYAAKVIRNADRVIARDFLSAAYVKKMIGKDIPVTTDLAFQLPYEKTRIISEKIKIGVNISGLLVQNAEETGFINRGDLKTNYDAYIDALLMYLTSNELYEVFLIPHVAEDYHACMMFQKKYPLTKLVNVYTNPIDIKSFISGMDIFIGARMHATIAAFTSGVVTIPTAYSRKFETMFAVVGYNVVIDMQTSDTEDALKNTIAYVKDSQKLKKQVEASLIRAQAFKKETERFFTEAIMELGGLQ